MLHAPPAAIQWLEALSPPPPARILPYVSLARFEPSCSVYGRECLLEFWQRVGNDTDLGDLAGETFGDLAGEHLERGQLLQNAVGFL